MSATQVLLLALAVASAFYIATLVRGLRISKSLGETVRPSKGAFAVGFVANFFDTLGIGSFAPTTAAFRVLRMVQSPQIPGTLNVGYAACALFQSFLFIASVQVEPVTLVGMISAAVAGAWIGAGWLSTWPKRRIQIGVGAALLVAGVLFGIKNTLGDPVGGTAVGLVGAPFAAGLAGNFLLGMLMTIGVGLYGPCMLLIAVLGMNPSTAFPIMMGSCAFLMPVASARIVREGAVNLSVAVSLAISSIPAVWLAYKFFLSLDVHTLRWLVAVVVLVTGISVLRTALSSTVSQSPVR